MLHAFRLGDICTDGVCLFFFFLVLSNCLCMYSWIRNATTIDSKSLNPYFLLATASCVHLVPLQLLATKILPCHLVIKFLETCSASSTIDS